MDLNQILAQYDSMFGQKSLLEIEEYLVNTIRKAEAESEKGFVLRF